MIHRLRFVQDVDMREVADTLDLAFLAASILHGEATIRLCAGHLVSKEKHSVVVRHETEAGRSAMVLVVGFCSTEYGESSFTVEKVSDDPGGAASRAGDDPGAPDGGAATTR